MRTRRWPTHPLQQALQQPPPPSLRATCALALSLALGACSQAPVLQTPDVAVPPAYKEAGPWAQAVPGDALPRGAWWKLYGDAELDALQQRLIDASPDLAAALARHRQAMASTGQFRASQLPSVNVSANTQGNRQSELRPLRVLGPNSPDEYRSTTLGFDLGYEFDVWGRIAGLVAAGAAQEQAAAGDLESARLSLQAQLADSFIALRGIDRDLELLGQSEAGFARALELVRNRHEGGIASGLDLARAQAQLETTRSLAGQVRAQRALVEHAIASLVGEPATGFSIAPRTAELPLPAVPPGVPSALLQRRPDIAAAQRRMAAANASVGVARAAYFPVVTLGATLGYQTSDIRNFLQAPNTFWAIGPNLVMSLFDGGRRDAEVARAQAALDEAGARYRGVVVGAFQQVEDSLALLERLREAAESERAAVAAAQHSLDLATTRYRQGAASYLEVVASQTAALQARRSAQDLATRQRRASVQLIRALGGGWMAEAEPLAHNRR